MKRFSSVLLLFIFTFLSLSAQKSNKNIFNMIRGGEFKLSESEVFTADDSHYDLYKINYMAYQFEEPIFHRAFAFKILVTDKIFQVIYKGTQMTRIELILYKFSFFCTNYR